MNNFSEILINWYREHKRELPWRESSDPYLIWISEIILQQTRVVQGYDYFIRFIKRFPDVTSLAEADEDEVMKFWQGLGYYSRARNLHAAARSMNGVFPKTYPEVLALKGVGEYTAAAICSFAIICLMRWSTEMFTGYFPAIWVLKHRSIPLKVKSCLLHWLENFWINRGRLSIIRQSWILGLYSVLRRIPLVFFAL